MAISYMAKLNCISSVINVIHEGFPFDKLSVQDLEGLLFYFENPDFSEGDGGFIWQIKKEIKSRSAHMEIRKQT